MPRLNLAVILGSTREARRGEVVARWFTRLAAQRQEISVSLEDLRDWDLPIYAAATPPSVEISAHPKVQAWSEAIARADGFVVITPEYNHGYPAPLKNALDSVFHEWARKPIGFIGYGGLAAGARAVEQLRGVAVELSMAPIRNGVVIPRVRTAFGEDGTPGDPLLSQLAETMLDDWTWWATALKSAREESQPH